jgi:hypothetical protein
MANNRIFLFCPMCQEAVYLAKCYYDGYFRSTGDREELGNAFVDFMDEHLWCDDSGQALQVELRWECYQADPCKGLPPYQEIKRFEDRPERQASTEQSEGHQAGERERALQWLAEQYEHDSVYQEHGDFFAEMLARYVRAVTSSPSG